jgi:hypothetical protein
MFLTWGSRGKGFLEYLKPFIYCVEAVDKGKVGYWRGAYNVITNVVNSLFLLLVYTEVVFIFGIELIIDSKLVLVQLG